MFYFNILALLNKGRVLWGDVFQCWLLIHKKIRLPSVLTVRPIRQDITMAMADKMSKEQHVLLSLYFLSQ